MIGREGTQVTKDGVNFVVDVSAEERAAAVVVQRQRSGSEAPGLLVVVCYCCRLLKYMDTRVCL